MAALKDDIAEMKVTMADFENALEDVKPAFGVDDESLSRAFERGIIPYSPAIQEIMDEGRKYSSIVSCVC
jgi:vesicle-fusing ATPase